MKGFAEQEVDLKAEQEADKIGKEYKGKQDVKKSMEKDFGADFSKVEERNRNTDEFVACATGTNVFFGKNVLQNSSLKNEVTAHEYAHVLQQQAVPVAEDAKRSVQQTVPEGVVQGWGGWNLSKLFKKKRVENQEENSEEEKRILNAAKNQRMKQLLRYQVDTTLSGEELEMQIEKNRDGFASDSLRVTRSDVVNNYGKLLRKYANSELGDEINSYIDRSETIYNPGPTTSLEEKAEMEAEVKKIAKEIAGKMAEKLKASKEKNEDKMSLLGIVNSMGEIFKGTNGFDLEELKKDEYGDDGGVLEKNFENYKGDTLYGKDMHAAVLMDDLLLKGISPAITDRIFDRIGTMSNPSDTKLKNMQMIAQYFEKAINQDLNGEKELDKDNKLLQFFMKEMNQDLTVENEPAKASESTQLLENKSMEMNQDLNGEKEPNKRFAKRYTPNELIEQLSDFASIISIDNTSKEDEKAMPSKDASINSTDNMSEEDVRERMAEMLKKRGVSTAALEMSQKQAEKFLKRRLNQKN